ncbi:cholecystokinin receptor-like [Asterias rubens]|uniref:cholecystokinin receptor-like n=1 Tax=Asterias rubens TaxID=7604 RepID=UPI0014557AB3|nr:cholecystokinin receptor-like [Asterias rubens]
MAEALLILRILKTIIGVVGILDNGLVILVISRVKFMHTLTNTFICHQAVIDFIGSLLLLLQSNIPNPDPVPDTMAGQVLCRVWIGDAMLWLFFVISTFNLLGLTLERYAAIVYPLKYRTFFDRRPAIIIMILAWIIGILLKSYSFIIYNVVEGVCKFQRVSVSFIIGPLLIVLQYFLPAGVMLFCYIHTAISLKKGALRVAPVPAPIIIHVAGSEPKPPVVVNDQQESLFRARRNTFKTLVIVFAVFLICWSPSQITFFMFNCGWLQLDFTGALNVFSTFLVAANCCINPIVYSMKYKQFQRGVKCLFYGDAAIRSHISGERYGSSSNNGTAETHTGGTRSK